MIITRFVNSTCAKPRQNRADVWKKRPVVLKYRQFADDCREAFGESLKDIRADRLTVTVTFAVKPSWSKKKQQAMLGKPHRFKPDADNLLKAVMDSLWKDGDSGIYDVRCTKRWGSADITEITVEQVEPET